MPIGLSLSFCVREIAEGKVDIETVSRIYCGTKVETDDQWEALLDRYCQIYWTKCMTHATNVANTLRSQGKLTQPRLNSKRVLHKESNSILWADSEDDLLWLDLDE